MREQFNEMSVDEQETYLLERYWAAERQMEYYRRLLSKLRGAKIPLIIETKMDEEV